MKLIIDIFFILVSLLLLWKGSEWLVDSSVTIASRFGVSQLVIGLTIVAMGTSAPEFAVTIGAALKGQLNISVSNVIGSNVFNLGFILGGVALIRAIRSPDKIVSRDGLFLIASSVIICYFLYDFRLTRLESFSLFVGLIVYIWVLFRVKREVDLDVSYKHSFLTDIIILLVSVAMVILGAWFLREGAVNIARAAGVSEWVIGTTIIAAGTSIPEFAASLVASIKGQHGISIGNLIGSCLYNSLGVLGLAGLIKPMVVSVHARSSTLLLLGLVIIVVIMLQTHRRLTRLEGALLFSIGLVIWVVEFI